MAHNRRSLAAGAISCALALLLLTAVYQRMANPDLSRHLDHAQEDAPAQNAAPTLPPQEAEALSRAMAELQNAPGDVARILAVADIFNRNRDWQNALAFTARATTTAPNDFRPWYYLGVTQANSGDFPAAAKSFERTIAIAPDSDRARFNLAIIYRHYLNQPEKAAALLKAIVNSPTADAALKERATAELTGT